jgi:hypothetical protein
MSDTNAQPTPTVTQGWATGGPLPVPDNQPMRAIPEQPNMVAIRYGEPPTLTAEDLERQRLARIKPADKSAGAIRIALANVASDTVIATARVEGLQDQVQRLLHAGGSVSAIQQARLRMSDAQTETDQLHAMAASLQVSLVRAEQAEAAELAALAARVPAAQAAVEAFREFALKKYAKLAAELEAGLAMETAAEAAMTTLKDAASRLGHKRPADLPRVVTAGREEAMRARMCVPGWIDPPRNPFNIQAVYG